MKKKIVKSSAGFTMTELLIVMFIISLLSTSVLISFRNNERNYALDQSTQQLISNLRKAQNMAMNKVNVAGYDSYGIYAKANDNYYILYAADDSLGYDLSDETIETIGLLKNVKINSGLDVFFESPDPKTYINSSDVVGLSGSIVLEINDTFKTITITTAGLIQRN